MSYYAGPETESGSRHNHTTQFEYVGINFHDFGAVFLHQHNLVSFFEQGPDALEYFVVSAHQATGRRVVLCLDRDPVDIQPYVEVLQRCLEPSKWFVLSNDYSKPVTKNTAPWPYFLIAQQWHSNSQLGQHKHYRIGFVSGVPRPHRVNLWRAIKNHVRSNDVVVMNRFGLDTFYGDCQSELMDFLQTQQLPWSNRPEFIDQSQDQSCAHPSSSNSHPAFNARCCINAETCDEKGPLFFSEKTWKSYISGCLTVNYGPIESPKWLADHGVEIWSGDVVCSNQQKITIIQDLFRSAVVDELYHDNLPAIKYNQHLVDSRAFLRQMIEPSISALHNWAESR